MEVKDKLAHDAERMIASHDVIAGITGNILLDVVTAPNLASFDFLRLMGTKPNYVYSEFHSHDRYRKSKIVVGGLVNSYTNRGIGGFELLSYPESLYCIRYRMKPGNQPDIKYQRYLHTLITELYSNLYIGGTNGGSIPAAFLADNKQLHIQIQPDKNQEAKSSLYAEIPSHGQSVFYAPIVETKPGIPEQIIEIVSQMLEHGNLMLNYGAKENLLVTEMIYGGVDYSS